MLEVISSYDLLTMLLLFLASFSLWIVRASIALFLIEIATLIAVIGDRINLVGLVSLTVLTFAIRMYCGNWQGHISRNLLGCIVALGAYLFYLHFVPGFQNVLLLKDFQLSADSYPYSLWANIDKVIVGLLLMYYGRHQFNRTLSDWLQSFRVIPFPLIVLTGILMGGALAVHYVRFDPKLPSVILLWAPVNLFFVCVSEEALFRGFIQKELNKAFQNLVGGAWLAIGIASLLFGFLHYRGGIAYILWSAIAGVGYGYAYWRSGKIESSILLHFFVNLIHFVGFSYPALK